MMLDLDLTSIYTTIGGVLDTRRNRGLGTQETMSMNENKLYDLLSDVAYIASLDKDSYCHDALKAWADAYHVPVIGNDFEALLINNYDRFTNSDLRTFHRAYNDDIRAERVPDTIWDLAHPARKTR